MFKIYKACPSESGTEVGAPLFPAVELCLLFKRFYKVIHMFKIQGEHKFFP